MQYGDVVRVQLPRPQGKAGREQFGVRPAVVVQTAITASHSTVVVVPLTSNLAAASFSWTFIVDPDATNGLTLRSVVLTQQVRAIDKSRIESVIGTFGNADLLKLQSGLKTMLGL
jgi:mRNA-degrading endonuclease toxin of MazEF toxin-antitoxin module